MDKLKGKVYACKASINFIIIAPCLFLFSLYPETPAPGKILRQVEIWKCLAKFIHVFGLNISHRKKNFKLIVEC